MGVYLLIVDVAVCKVTPVILHGVVSPESTGITQTREGISGLLPGGPNEILPQSDFDVTKLGRLGSSPSELTDMYTRDTTLRRMTGVTLQRKVTPVIIHVVASLDVPHNPGRQLVNSLVNQVTRSWSAITLGGKRCGLLKGTPCLARA